jgi:hypothetical protein
MSLLKKVALNVAQPIFFFNWSTYIYVSVSVRTVIQSED